jgi:DNA-binding response OmpR family regulator
MAQTILVVDDEARIIQLMRDYLERAGFRVLTARVEEADRIVGLELRADD